LLTTAPFHSRTVNDRTIYPLLLFMLHLLHIVTDPFYLVSTTTTAPAAAATNTSVTSINSIPINIAHPLLHLLHTVTDTFDLVSTTTTAPCDRGMIRKPRFPYHPRATGGRYGNRGFRIITVRAASKHSASRVFEHVLGRTTGAVYYSSNYRSRSILSILLHNTVEHESNTSRTRVEHESNTNRTRLVTTLYY